MWVNKYPLSGLFEDGVPKDQGLQLLKAWEPRLPQLWHLGTAASYKEKDTHFFPFSARWEAQCGGSALWKWVYSGGKCPFVLHANGVGLPDIVSALWAGVTFGRNESNLKMLGAGGGVWYSVGEMSNDLVQAHFLTYLYTMHIHLITSPVLSCVLWFHGAYPNDPPITTKSGTTHFLSYSNIILHGRCT